MSAYIYITQNGCQVLHKKMIILFSTSNPGSAPGITKILIIWNIKMGPMIPIEVADTIDL